MVLSKEQILLLKSVIERYNEFIDLWYDGIDVNEILDESNEIYDLAINILTQPKEPVN